MKKFVLSIALMLIVALILNARTFEIKVMNTPNITIDGKEMSVGSHFADTAIITWKSPDQAMKVVSDDNRVYVVSPKLFSKYHVTNFNDFLSSVKSATVRNGGERFPITAQDHRYVFEGDFVLLDSLSFNVGWKTNDRAYFEATTKNPGDDNFTFMIPCVNDELVVSRHLFDSLQIPDGEIVVAVKYVELDYDEITMLTEAMRIIIVPEKI